MNHTISQQRNSRDTKNNGISLFLSQVKNVPLRFFELQSLQKNSFHSESDEEKLQNQILRNSIGNDIVPQVILGGTRLTGVGVVHQNF